MKVGIITYSYTGNTLGVAERLKEKIASSGHSVNLERVTAANEDPQARGPVQLRTAPDVSGYDVLVFGSPVRGFSLCPIMKAYLGQIPSLQDKKVFGFVTEYFPYPWMGGNRAIKDMENICGPKGASIARTGIVNWSRKKREKQITSLLDDFSVL